jgi:hypothetical protein
MGSTGGTQGGGGGQLRSGATGTGGVSSSNPLASSYANPLAAGLALAGVNSRTTFGNPLYANVNPTTTSGSSSGLGGSRGATGFGGSGGFAGLGSAGGYGSGAYGAGVRVAPKFSAAVSFSPPRTAATSGLQVNLQRMVSQSAALQASRDIQVGLDGSTVVLRGRATDEHDRRLAEAMVRLSPGVRDVRNELQVVTAAPPLPASGPAPQP